MVGNPPICVFVTKFDIAMPPKQVVAAGTKRLQDGTLLPMSTFNSEVLRLFDEAIAQPAPRPSNKWIVRRIKRSIPTLYGHTCCQCNQPIIMEWNGQPCWRELTLEDQHRHGLTTHAHFHTDCWRIYQREKAKTRRRTRYRYLRDAMAGNPQPAPLVFPGVGNPLPAPMEKTDEAWEIEDDEDEEEAEEEEEKYEEEEEEEAAETQFDEPVQHRAVVDNCQK